MKPFRVSSARIRSLAAAAVLYTLAMPPAHAAVEPVAAGRPWVQMSGWVVRCLERLPGFGGPCVRLVQEMPQITILRDGEATFAWSRREWHDGPNEPEARVRRARLTRAQRRSLSKALAAARIGGLHRCAPFATTRDGHGYPAAGLHLQWFGSGDRSSLANLEPFDPKPCSPELQELIDELLELAGVPAT